MTLKDSSGPHEHQALSPEELARWIAERFTEVLTEAAKKGDMRSSSGAVIGVVLGMGVGLAVSAGCPREVLETVFKKMLDKEYSS